MSAEDSSQDRTDLCLLLVEADGPLTLHQIAAATWDGTTSWPGHTKQVWGHLEAMRRLGQVAAKGALYVGAMTTLWGPADSPFGDACSDAAEVQRMLSDWEPADLPEVPC